MKVLVVASTPEEAAAVRREWAERGVQADAILWHGDVTEEIIAKYDLVCVTRRRALQVRQDRVEHGRARSELRRESEMLQQIADHIPVMLDVIDASGKFVWVNREFERVLGWKLEEVIGKDLMPELYPNEEQRRRVIDLLKQRDGKWMEFTPRRRDGTQVAQAWANVALSDGSTIGIGQDISARKLAEKLRDRFIEDVMQAQEDERRRLALELHDETGQSLTTLLVGLKTLEDEIQDPRHSARVGELRELTAKMVREVGRLARGLRPATLDDLGFAPAVEMHAAEFAKAHGLQVDLHLSGFDGRERLPARVETHLYRIAQEALTNVAKHANATKVNIVLRHDGGTVHAVIEDNGRGLAEEPTPHDARLASIRERVALLGGTMNIESAPGQGTTVFMTIPVLQLT